MWLRGQVHEWDDVQRRFSGPFPWSRLRTTWAGQGRCPQLRDLALVLSRDASLLFILCESCVHPKPLANSKIGSHGLADGFVCLQVLCRGAETTLACLACFLSCPLSNGLINLKLIRTKVLMADNDLSVFLPREHICILMKVFLAFSLAPVNDFNGGHLECSGDQSWRNLYDVPNLTPRGPGGRVPAPMPPGSLLWAVFLFPEPGM